MNEMNNRPKSEWYNLVLFITRRRKLNGIIYGVVFVLSVILVFFIIPKEYTAEVSVLPSAANSVSGLGGNLGNLASLAGVNLGNFSTRSQEMYMGLIQSRSLLEKIILYEYNIIKKGALKKINLIEYFEIEGDSLEVEIQKTLKKLRENVIATTLDRDNQILYVSVTLEDPELAAQVANLIVEYLNDLVLTEVQKEIADQLKYIDKRIQQTRDSLSIAEAGLQELLEKTTDPTLPQFQVAQIRARRQLEVQTSIYVEMRKQLELLYVENFSSLSPIKILDQAHPPYRKSRPKRLFVLITLLSLAGLLQIGVNWGLYIYRREFKNIRIEELDRESV